MCALKMFINWMGVEDRYVNLRHAEGTTVKAWNRGATEIATKKQLTWCSSNPYLLLFVVPPIPGVAVRGQREGGRVSERVGERRCHTHSSLAARTCMRSPPLL